MAQGDIEYSRIILTDSNEAPLLKQAKESSTNVEVLNATLDCDWVKTAFLVNDIDLADSQFPQDLDNRYWSSANIKFTDSRLGGNLGINARPQFTYYSDVPALGNLQGKQEPTIDYSGKLGLHMGRYYSESIDDHAQTIYLRFGVPQYNSLTDFFFRALNAQYSTLVRTGRAPSAWYDFGQAIGGVANVAVNLAFFTAFPVITGAILIGRFISSYFGKSTSKFYRLKPTMFLYWSTVNTLVNNIAVNSGMIPRVVDKFNDTLKNGNLTTKDAITGNDNIAQSVNSPYKFDGQMLKELHDLMPDVFNSQYGIDMFAAANRAQRTHNKRLIENNDLLSSSDYDGFVRKDYYDKINKEEGSFLANFINTSVKAITEYYGNDKKPEEQTLIELDPKVNVGTAPTDTATVDTGTTPKNTEELAATLPDSYATYFKAEFESGSSFAIFKVDNTGTTQEAFSNSVIESDLSNKINGITSQAREIRFSFAEGNVLGGAFGKTLDSALSAAGDVVGGLADSVTLLNLFHGLTGSGYIDIPKHWQSSNATLTRNTYTIQLVSPYGNVVSKLMNIYIPLAMILAGALPLSTGRQSYTSPFICQLFDRGRCQIQLGMIDSLSITRGTTNLPFNAHGKPMGIDVSFSVIDMSTIMHMPVSAGGLFSADVTLDEDNILMDYLAVLAGQDLYSQFYAMPKAKIAMFKKFHQLNTFTSPAYWASMTHDSMTTGLMNYMFPGKTIQEILSTSNNATLPKGN